MNKAEYLPAARSVIAVFLAATSCSHTVAPPPTTPSPLLERATPRLRARALDGSSVDTDGLRGRVIVIDFFAEHCAPCAVSLPVIESLHQRMPEVAFVGVSEDDDAAGAARLVRRLNVSFSVVHDGDRGLAGRFRVVDLPATFVVDAGGVVRWRGNRAHTEEELRAVVGGVR